MRPAAWSSGVPSPPRAYSVSSVPAGVDRDAARASLNKLLRRARFRRVCPDQARLYALGELRFIVSDGALITVYRQTYADAGKAHDLWCLA